MENDKINFFGEWVYWENEEELVEAHTYLSLWKKFILKRLNNMQQEGHDQIILRPAMYQENMRGVMPNLERGTLALKISMKGKLPNDEISEKELSNFPRN